MKQNSMKYSYLALAIVAALNSQVISAQAEPTDDESASADQVTSNNDLNDSAKVNHIIVTARRTAENLQSVPVSMTSINASDLAENGITVISDIQQYIPNTTLQVSRGTNSTLTAYIRGIGQQDPLWGYEPGVGIYVDDVYIARPQGAVMEILDIERIEVLRGPQGTLYGKNTIGGAMKYVTRKMTGESEFGLSTTFGNYGLNNYKISGQLPLANDELYIGFAFADINRDGFGTFINNGEDNYNKDVFTGRLNFEYRPSDDLFFRLNFDRTTDKSNSKGGYRLVPSLLTGQQPYDSVYDSDTSLPVFNKVETEGASFTAEWNINDRLTFKSVTATREGYTDTNIDFDNTALKSFDVPAIVDDEQLTQEFQFSYVNDGLTAVGGLYYYDGEACGAFDAQLEVLGQFLGAPGLSLESGGCSDTESSSIYGQTSFDLADQWSMTLGGRYTRDQKDAFIYKHTFFQTVYPGEFESGNAIPIDPNNEFNNDESWSHFSPRIGVEYQLSDDLMYYASFTDGFKSGGFNMRADLGADPEAHKPYDPEIVKTSEIGFKSEWLDNSLRVNATYFYSDYSDMQVTVQRALTADTFVTRVLNAGEAEIQGFEFESIYAATNNLTLNLTVGYIDAKFVEFIDVDPSTGLAVNRADDLVISNTPDWSVNAGMSYQFITDIGDFVLTSNVAYRGKTHIFEIPTELDEDSYTLVNLGLSYYSGESWSASLQIKNVFDEEYRIAGYNFLGLGAENSVIGYYGDPQTVALTVSYEF